MSPVGTVDDLHGWAGHYQILEENHARGPCFLSGAMGGSGRFAVCFRQTSCQNDLREQKSHLSGKPDFETGDEAELAIHSKEAPGSILQYSLVTVTQKKWKPACWLALTTIHGAGASADPQAEAYVQWLFPNYFPSRSSLPHRDSRLEVRVGVALAQSQGSIRTPSH